MQFLPAYILIDQSFGVLHPRRGAALVLDLEFVGRISLEEINFNLNLVFNLHLFIYITTLIHLTSILAFCWCVHCACVFFFSGQLSDPASGQ